MTQKIVNFTLMMVTRGVDLVLSTYPYDPYQVAFEDSDLRNQLIVKVLKQTPSNYILANLDRHDPLLNQVLQMTLREHLLIKSLIHQGIHQLLPVADRPPVFYYPPNTPSPASSLRRSSAR